MSKQTPMLMESPLTKRVFVVTSYKDKGDGIFEARQKYDVTEQFDALAWQRNETCKVIHDQDGIPRCSNCQNVLYDEYKDGIVRTAEGGWSDEHAENAMGAAARADKQSDNRRAG